MGAFMVPRIAVVIWRIVIAIDGRLSVTTLFLRVSAAVLAVLIVLRRALAEHQGTLVDAAA